MQALWQVETKQVVCYLLQARRMTVTASIRAMLALETTMMRQTNLERGMRPGPATGMGDSDLDFLFSLSTRFDTLVLSLPASSVQILHTENRNRWAPDPNSRGTLVKDPGMVVLAELELLLCTSSIAMVADFQSCPPFICHSSDTFSRLVRSFLCLRWDVSHQKAQTCKK